jgi:hypothetical protein
VCVCVCVCVCVYNAQHVGVGVRSTSDLFLPLGTRQDRDPHVLNRDPRVLNCAHHLLTVMISSQLGPPGRRERERECVCAQFSTMPTYMW